MLPLKERLYHKASKLRSAESSQGKALNKCGESFERPGKRLHSSSTDPAGHVRCSIAMTGWVLTSPAVPEQERADTGLGLLGMQGNA